MKLPKNFILLSSWLSIATICAALAGCGDAKDAAKDTKEAVKDAAQTVSDNVPKSEGDFRTDFEKRLADARSSVKDYEKTSQGIADQNSRNAAVSQSKSLDKALDDAEQKYAAYKSAPADKINDAKKAASDSLRAAEKDVDDLKNKQKTSQDLQGRIQALKQELDSVPGFEAKSATQKAATRGASTQPSSQRSQNVSQLQARWGTLMQQYQQFEAAPLHQWESSRDAVDQSINSLKKDAEKTKASLSANTQRQQYVQDVEQRLEKLNAAIVSRNEKIQKAKSATQPNTKEMGDDSKALSEAVDKRGSVQADLIKIRSTEMGQEEFKAAQDALEGDLRDAERALGLRND